MPLQLRTVHRDSFPGRGVGGGGAKNINQLVQIPVPNGYSDVDTLSTDKYVPFRLL